jgi:hypothetical protein
MENKIIWHTNIKKALKQAGEEKKHVLIDFFNPE